MSISVELTSKDMINSYFERVCLGDVDKFKTDLLATNTPKLQKIKKALDIKASDKKEAIESIIKLICMKGNEEMTEETQVMGETPAELTVEPVEENIPPEDDYPIMQIKVDPELLALVPRPSRENFEILKKSIQERGLNDPIEVLPDGRIIDGHSRFKAFEELGMLPVPPDKIRVVNLTEEELMTYMFDQNIARRHLTDIDRIEWAVRLMPIEEVKKEVKKAKEEKRQATKAGKKAKEVKPERSRDKIAKKAGISPAQQARYNVVEKWAPEMLEEAKKDKSSLGNVYLKVKNMVKEIKEKMPEVLDQITEKAITLTDAYAACIEKFPEGKKEKPDGPMAKQVLSILELVTKKILVKKYGGAEYTPDEYWQELIERLDALLQKNRDAGK